MKISTLAVLVLAAVGGAVRAAPPVKASGQESLIELIPARARVAAILRGNLMLPARDLLGSDPDMMRELQPYLDRSLGIDLTRIEGVAVFSMDVTQGEPHFGVILRIPTTTTGPLHLPTAGDAGGTPMYRLDREIVVARIKAGLAIGHEGEVSAAVAVDKGREPALPKDAGLGKLLATELANVDAVLAVGPGALPPGKTMGIEDGVLIYRHSGPVELALHGDPNQLQALRGMAQGAIQVGLSSLAQEKDKATATNDPLKGITAILTYYQAKKLAAELDPKVEGNALKVRYTLPDPQKLGGSTVGIAIVGVLAAIAIPNFQKFQARAKTQEAKMNISRINTSLMLWASDASHKLTSLKSTDWAPATRCCGQADNKCAPEPKAWSAPTWKAIAFSIDDPNLYQYRIVVDAKQKPARVTIEARGDLDCDNVLSSYKQTITIGPKGPESGSLEMSNETE